MSTRSPAEFFCRSPKREAILKTRAPVLSKSGPSAAGLILGGKGKERIRSFRRKAEAECSEFPLTMARQEGFEPPTYCLEGSCSILLSYWRMYATRTNVISDQIKSQRSGFDLERRKEITDVKLSRTAEAEQSELLPTLERVMGIEPTYPAWKAGVLPLNYTRTSSHSALR